MLLFAFTLRAQESSSTVVTWGCTGCGGGAVAIATGYSHALMLGRDGTVSACGTYTFFQGQSGVQVPPGLSNVIAVAAGWSDNLVLKRDGTVAGWDRFGNQTNLPTGLTNVVAIAAGVENHLALRADGMVVSLDAGNTDLPLGLTNVVAVSAGSGSIALKADGTVVACGWSPEWSNSLSELTNVVAVSAGYQEWLALKADGTVSGGGFHEIPSGLSDVQAIASSFGNDYHLSSVLKTDGTVLSWGFNFCGGGYTTNLWGPSYAVAISAGAAFNAALIGGGPPFLTSSLLNRTATVNGTAYFRIEATGARPLRYQWQFNGEPIPDATNSVLALTGVQPGQAGRYSVNVSNPSGTVTSGEAVLSVVPVMISIPPQDQLAFVRGTAQFSVVAQGDGALSYQWRHNGESIEGATNSVLQLNDVQISDAGSYSVLVSNAFGGVLSASALLTVTPILITTQPQDRVTFIGGPTVLEVVAQGKEPLTYQWALNGKPIEGGTNSMLSLTDLQPEQAGICSVTVSNAFGTAISRVVKLSVVPIASWGVFDLTTVPPDLTNVLAVSAGAYQAFALKPDGAWVSWGSGSGFPPDLTNVVAATAGFTFSLALKDNGTVVAWGGTNYGETDVPAGLTNVVEIAAQYFHSLALTADGRVAAWGLKYAGSDSVPVGLSNVVGIAAGAYHNLALKSDGSIVVWGDNQFGQTNVPTDIHDAVSIAAGWWHNLVLRANGTVLAFGYNERGESTVPAGLNNVVAIACGNFHSLALKADGTVVVWGYGDIYYPDFSEYGQAIVPQGLTNVTSVVGADYFSLALIGDGPRAQQALSVDPNSDGNSFRVSLSTEVRRVYRLEYKDDLQDMQWTAFPLVAGNGRLRKFEDTTSHGAHRFYRVMRW